MQICQGCLDCFEKDVSDLWADLKFGEIVVENKNNLEKNNTVFYYQIRNFQNDPRKIVLRIRVVSNMNLNCVCQINFPQMRSFFNEIGNRQ